MNISLFPQPWLVNNLLDAGFVEHHADQLVKEPLPYGLDGWLAQHFDGSRLGACNEAQLENSLIRPLLEQLGWHVVPQMSYTVQGKNARPDWCLALDAAAAGALPGSDAGHATQYMAAICEAKAWDKALDTGKAHADNPHHQLMDYLATLRVRFGILTNGRHWRLYDTQEITARKTYLQIDLEQVLSLTDLVERDRALALFAFFFGRNTYVPPAPVPQTAAQASPIEQAIWAAETHALAVEENLKAVIYGFEGEDSLFEHIGKGLWQACSSQKASRPTLQALYDSAVILLFRLLFIVYFEDRNRELLAAHPFYSRYSLKTIYKRLHQGRGTEADQRFDGLHDLKELFQLLDEGAPDIDLPLFNGGLFDPERAPLLRAPKIFSNASLRQMLEKLLYKTQRGQTLFDTPRDFNTMSVTHLGRIYEGLLEFRFEQAHEAATYLEYSSAATRGQTVEAYFDAYDTALIRQEKGFRALREISVKKGDIYLKSANNSRKTSASYYTPPALTERLVKAGIDHALAQGKSLAEIRVLDNACGSGHFLVEALGYLTDRALQRLSEDQDLQQLVAEESQKITEQLALLNLPSQLSDAQIIKRVLLKRCIYGVDLNPFAIELARLSLWMDSFIFGTPLSFIEHHIRHGNALLGASVQDFIEYNASEWQQSDLFVDDLRNRFNELRTVMTELDALRDTTAAEVAQSKAKWRQDIAPRLAVLSRTLSFLSARRMLLAAGDKKAAEALDKTPNLLHTLFDSPLSGKGSEVGVLKTIAEHERRWHFFHYEVAFPEAFGAANPAQRGFDVIAGNPPWDKTKFADSDFFPQYHSNYRSLKNQAKATVQKRLLASEHIAKAYEAAQQNAAWVNEAYKALYPLNRGAGDGNLFRFFTERSLSLLAAGGSLNYCLPSALMFEEGSQTLRQHIFKHYKLVFFYSFENREGLFPDVDSRYKFALMQVAKPANSEQRAEKSSLPQPSDCTDTAFYLLNLADLRQPGRRVPYSLATVKTLSPQQWALMELRHADDLPILQRCYSAFAPLSPDWLDFRNELHMTNDKDLFLEQPASGLLPLFEGKMIWQYSNQLEQAQYWLKPAAMDARLRSKEIHRMAQDLGLKKAEAEKHTNAICFDRDYVRLGFRAVASDTNERTLIFALLPKGCGFGHSMFAVSAKRYVLRQGQAGTEPLSLLRQLFALAWLNSLVVDWLGRQMIQMNVSLTYLYRLPIPQPADDAAILADADWRTLARNALRLTLHASTPVFAADLADAMQALSVTASDVPSTAKACDQLRAENDRIVARCYGLNAQELQHVLQGFPVMARKRPEYLALLQD